MVDICQVLAGDALTWFEPPDSAKFEHLFAAVKPPSLEIEGLAMEATLRRFTERLARTIHTNFHVRFVSSPCAFSAPALAIRHNERHQLLVRASLSDWAEQLRLDFLAAHNSAAQRARRLLDASAAAASIDELARLVAVGKRTLERRFRVEVGIGIAEYRTRLRLALIVREVHGRRGSVESAALIAGWGTKKGLYDALHERTRMNPTDIRELSPTEVNGLVASLMICGRGQGKIDSAAV